MKKHKNTFGIVLFIVLFSYFLILMDNSIIFTSSVKISEELNMSTTTLTWVSSAYTITFGGFLLLAGRLGDLIGRKRIFLIGLIIFGLASLFIGVSNSALAIIIWRTIQGVGSAIIAPTSLALLMDTYTGQMRSKAIAYYGATAGIGSSIGLLIGGWLTSAFSWRAGFLINVPLAIILVILSMIKLKSSKWHKQKIDYAGAILSVVMSLLFVYGITERNLLIISISILVFGGFIVRETHINFALVPMTLFQSKTRVSAYIVRFIFMMSMLPYWLILPQIMQGLYQFTPLQAGMGFLPLSLVTFLSALSVPRLTNRYGNGTVMLSGQIILLSGMVISAFINPNTGYIWTIGIPMLLVGLGQGWLVAPLTAAGIAGAPANESGVASGMTNVMHQLGGPVGLSIISVLTSNVSNLTTYYHMVMLIISSFLIIGLFILLLSRYKK